MGGELEHADATRVDAWLAAHPEDQESLAASEAAAGVLFRHAEITREREAPDLWAGIRSELVSSGLIVSADGGNGSSPAHERSVTPILGGPSWFQRKSVAAAAALMLTGSVGLMLMSRGASPAGWTGDAPSEAPMGATSMGAVAGTGGESARPTEFGRRPSRSSASGQGVSLASAGQSTGQSTGQSPAGGATIAGTDAFPMDVRAVGSQFGSQSRPPQAGSSVAGKVERLRRSQPGEGRLIDEALPGYLWQVDPWVSARRAPDGPQLTSGGR